VKGPQHLVDYLIASEEQDILEWLSPSGFDFSSAQNAARGIHAAGTGQWLLEDPRYTEWRDEIGGLLWLRGAGRFQPSVT
jgi:hypothetical protein